MKTIVTLLAAGALLAQEAKPAVSQIAPTLDSSSSGKSIIVIEPKARSADFVQAFDFLRKDKPSQKIMIRTASMIYSSVTDVTASTGGTLLMIKTLSNQGVRTHFVPVEQIMEIGYSL